MPVNSVATLVLGLLDQLPLPGQAAYEGNLTAYITPPDPDNLDSAHAYIWPATGEETRLSSPRAGTPGATAPGWKHLIHRVELWLAWISAGDDSEADVTFPAVLDAVMACLRAAPNPAEVTDPVTGQQSSILIDIGEDLVYEYSVPHSLEDQRLLRWDARLTLTCTEYFQA